MRPTGSAAAIRRLDPNARAELEARVVATYSAGATIKATAIEHELATGTVRAILDRRGVVGRGLRCGRRPAGPSQPTRVYGEIERGR